MNREEQEQRYREAMRARRAGEVCPLCGKHHTPLSDCAYPSVIPEKLPPLARTSDVETSHDAAAAGDKHALRHICLALYADHPEGLVDDDLAIYAGYSDGHESYRRRGSDLRALGWTEWLMEDAGTTPTGILTPVRRKTSLGATARVSVITPLGRKVYENYGGAQ